MKHKIGTLAVALGLMMAIPAMASPATGKAGENQAAGKQQTEKVKLSELPQSVQTTINQHIENGKIKHIDRVTENGQTFYNVSLKNANGEKQEFRVDSSGQFLSPQTKGMNQTPENNASPTPQSGGMQQEK